MSIRDVLRSGATDKELVSQLQSVLQKRTKDGFEAEQSRYLNMPVSESMATIGG